MGGFEPCPYCLCAESQPVKFTPWGGVVGPKVFSLVKCGGCGEQFNGRSGRKVDKAIRVYTCVMLVTLVVLAAGMIYAYAGVGVQAAGMS